MESNIPGFFKKTLEERRQILREFAQLTEEDSKLLENALDLETADKMIENVVGKYELPLGLATNFKIDGEDYIIPMVIEEPSIVAAASHGAKLCRPEGFITDVDKPIMKAMVQLVGIKDIEKAQKLVIERKKELIETVRDPNSSLVKLGGGVFDIIPRIIETKRGKMLIVDVICNCKDAMGANAVNTAAETIAPLLEKLTSGRRRLMIVSNLADQRLARAETIWKKDILGEDIIEGILDAYEFAENDIYRCSTQNKGIMNGIDAVSLATGNDFRALEAGAHSFAAKRGYCSLTKYEKTADGHLKGSIEIPLAIGIIGGATKTQPLAKLSLKILRVKESGDLARIMAAVGLAQNFAALRAQVVEGIQTGHMKLHAKNIALSAGAGENIDKIAEQMIKENKISVTRAKSILYENTKLVVFDLDGTLSPSKSPMDAEMSQLLSKLLEKKSVAVISGGSYNQFLNQFVKSLNSNSRLLKNLFLFPTCSTSFYKYLDEEWKQVYSNILSEEEKEKIFDAFDKALKTVNFVPAGIHGKLIEDRGTQITFSGLGQLAPLELKEKWDPNAEKRLEIKKALEKYIPEFDVRIGGTTSIDVTQKGIDKAYGIQQIEKYLGFSKQDMLFIGDALFEGGNDYPVKKIGVECIEVSGPEETKKIIQEIIDI